MRRRSQEITRPASASASCTCWCATSKSLSLMELLASYKRVLPIAGLVSSPSTGVTDDAPVYRSTPCPCTPPPPSPRPRHAHACRRGCGRLDALERPYPAARLDGHHRVAGPAARVRHRGAEDRRARRGYGRARPSLPAEAAPTGVVLAVSLLVLVPGATARRGSAVAMALGSVIVAGLALRVGHAGGQLVYVHGAAAPHVAAAGGAPAASSTARGH